MRITLSLLLCLCLSPFLSAQEKAPLNVPDIAGDLDGNQYRSPTGVFSIQVPVLAELGGRISDTTNVVTFEDAFTTHVTIAIIPLDEAMRADLTAKGKKDFLIQFFSNGILAPMRASLPNSKIESAKMLNRVHDGALFTTTLLPGGSRFSARTALFGQIDPLTTAKRGNLLFLHGDNIVILSSELGEKSTERSLYTKSVEEENEILQKRLLHLVETMNFQPGTASVSAPTLQPAK